MRQPEREGAGPISGSDLEDRILQAADEAFARVMTGVPEQVETMPPDLDLADALRWAGDRITELLASLSELPLEALLGEPGGAQAPTGEPLHVRASAGMMAETRVWVHPVGELPPGVLQFLLSDLVTADGQSIPGSPAGFTPEQLSTPVPVGAATLLRLPVPADAVPGRYHGHVFAQGVIGAAVPIEVTVG